MRLFGNKGFALVMVLLMTTLMVAIVTELIHQVYVDVSMSRGFRDGQQASLLAESGVTGAVKLLQMSMQNKDYTALTDPWAMPNRLDDEVGSIEVSISDESGKLNLNNLVQPNGELDTFLFSALKRLGSSLNISDEIWYALADWIDKDDLPRSNGGENTYYLSQKPSFSCRNNMLLSLSELSLLRGFKLEWLNSLRPFVTVYSAQPGAPLSQVNINTAPKEVLMALDEAIDERMAERIMEERRLKPFRNTGELSRISGGEVLSQKLVGKATVKGTLFRIVTVGKVKETARTVETVLRTSGGGTPDILYWQEY